MQLKPEQLGNHLQKTLAPLYVIYGDEALLVQEAADSLRDAARAAGYTEREVMTVEPGFNWSSLNFSGNSLSLFAEKKLVELRIPGGKPGVEGAQALQDYVRILPEDTLTIVTLPKLDKTAQASKWFTALEKASVAIAVWPVERNQLPAWISARLAQQKQRLDRDALQFLADKVEGNLLAALQEIRKLALLFPEGELSFDSVREAVLDVSRYDVFKLSEALLTGDPVRFARMLDGLRAEGESPVLVLWAISEEIRTLLKLALGLQKRLPLAQLLRENRVWGERQRLMEPALRRIKPAQLQAGLARSADIDRMIKGIGTGDVWDALLGLGLSLCPATAKAFAIQA